MILALVAANRGVRKIRVAVAGNDYPEKRGQNDSSFRQVVADVGREILEVGVIGAVVNG